MPKIPSTYERSVRAAPVAGAKLSGGAPIEAFGGGRALQHVNAAQDLVGMTNKIVEQEYDRANKTQLSAYNAKVAEWETNFLYDPNNGVMTRKGSAAFSAPEEANEAFQKFHGELEEELATNRDLRDAIRQTKAQRWADIDRAVQRHVGVERKRYEDESHVAFLENERNAAVKSGDLTRIGESIGRQRQEVESYAERNGISADEKNRRLLEVTSKTHRGHINQVLAAGDDLTARRYFEDNKDGIAPNDRDDIMKMLRQENVKGDAQRIATDVMNKHAGDLKAALKETRDRTAKDADKQEAAVREVKTRFEENKQIQSAQQEKLSRAVLNSISTRKMLPDPETWNAMPKEDQKAFELYLQMARENIEPPTISTKFYELKTMMNAEDRSAFINMNILPYRPYLNNKDFNDITTFQMELRAGKIAGAEEVRTTSQIISGVLRQNGIDPTPKDGKNAQWELVEKFTRDAEDEINKATKEKGRPLDSKEKKAIVDSFVVEAPVRGSLWDHLSSGRLDITKPILNIKFEDIPAPEVSKIEASIKARGGNPTKALITETYRKGQSRKARRSAE